MLGPSQGGPGQGAYVQRWNYEVPETYLVLSQLLESINAYYSHKAGFTVYRLELTLLDRLRCLSGPAHALLTLLPIAHKLFKTRVFKINGFNKLLRLPRGPLCPIPNGTILRTLSANYSVQNVEWISNGCFGGFAGI